MLSLVLLPLMSEAFAAASASPASHAVEHQPPAGVEPGDDLADDTLDVQVDTAPECLIGAVPAALPAAAPAHVPSPGLQELQVRWPEGLQQASWRTHAWPAWRSRGPPHPRRC